MKNKITLFLIVLFIFSCSETQTDKAVTSDTGKSINEDNLVSVVVEHPKQRSFEANIEITGTLEAYQQVKLHAMVGGFIKHIYKDIGDFVPAGGVIAVLENPVLYQQMKMAEAGLKTAEANIVKSKSKG